MHKLRCRSLGGGVAFCSSCRKHGPTSRMMHEFDWMSIRMADQCYFSSLPKMLSISLLRCASALNFLTRKM